MEGAFKTSADGILLRVRLTPRAAKDAVEGLTHDGNGSYLRARVRAVPEDGKANAALIELLAEEIGIPKSRMTIAGGASSRLKTVAIAGDAGKVTAWLEKMA